MNLELGITIDCTEIGCQVQCVSDDRVISTNYSALVLDRIQIQKQQLVAIDTRPLMPEIVWRWVRAIVLEVNNESIGIEGCLGQIDFASRVSELPLSLSIGDEVWFCNTDQELEVHDLIVDGKPAHPDQLIEYITPIIKRVYAA